MIPTIQLIYGTMPKIVKSKTFDTLWYNRDFYFCKNIPIDLTEAHTTPHPHKSIVDFLCEKFRCWSIMSEKYNNLLIKDKSKKYNLGRSFIFYPSEGIITLYGVDSSEIINTLITDDFYDSFQVLLSNLKTQ